MKPWLGWFKRLLFLSACTFGGMVQAQPADYPRQKAITIVSPTAAGSAADTIARLVAQKLGESFSPGALVENRPGAGGNIAAQHVKRAAADGYTMFVHSNSLVINPSLYANAGYDAQNDFVAVLQGPRTPNLIGVHPSVAAGNLAELIALARKQSLSYASSGIGTTAHLSMERIKLLAGIEMTHVPYQPAQATGAAVAGHVQVVQTSMPPTIPQVKSGRLKAIAVTGAQRSPALPDVPTVAESGYAGFDDVTWFGFFLPAGAAPDVVLRLNLELNRILELEDVKARLAAPGFNSARNTSAEFAEVIRTEIPKWAKVARESGARAE